MDLSKKTTTMTLLISLVFFFFIVSGDPLLAQTPGETELHKLKAPVDVDAKGIDNEPRIPGEWKLPEASPELLREGYSVAKGPIDGTNGLNIVAGCVPKPNHCINLDQNTVKQLSSRPPSNATTAISLWGLHS